MPNTYTVYLYIITFTRAQCGNAQRRSSPGRGLHRAGPDGREAGGEAGEKFDPEKTNKTKH